MAKVVRRQKPKCDAFDQEREKNRAAGRMETLSITTRVPSKWRFVDLETGDIWKWDGTFVQAEDIEIKAKK